MSRSVSIIIPTLNEADTIVAQLDLLQSMRERGVEVIVVDGGSSDATVRLVHRRADALLRAPRGRALQMNAGARQARGDILLFLHADTRLPPQADELIIEGLARTHKTWGRFDVAIDGAHPMLTVVALLMNWRSRLTGIATGDQAVFVRRSAFERCGGFPEIALMEDIALSRKLKWLGRPLCLPQRAVTSGRRWERNGVTHTIVLMWWLRLAYFLGVDPARLVLRYHHAGREN